MAKYYQELLLKDLIGELEVQLFLVEKKSHRYCWLHSELLAWLIQNWIWNVLLQNNLFLIVLEPVGILGDVGFKKNMFNTVSYQNNDIDSTSI